MKSFAKYISQYLLIFAVVIFGLVSLNVLAFGLTFYRTILTDYGQASPQTMLEKFSEDGSEVNVSEDIQLALLRNNIWAMFLAEDGNPAWQYNTPSELPQHYAIQDIAVFSRGYLCDYPVFVRSMSDGLLVLGYPKNSYTKLTSNYYSFNAIQTLPVYVMGILVFDLSFLFVACYVSKRRIIQNTEPIIAAVETLADGKPVDLSIRGDLSEVAASVNKISHVISYQNKARANWISGVSHDIRTPLSMIMGYAERIETDRNTAEAVKAEAAIIRQQSIKIKELVQDLNLVSKLEYEMQPLHKESVRLSKLLRSCAAELLNSGLSDAYTVDIAISPDAETFTMECDIRLLSRAINNLTQNSIRHNPEGCSITFALDCTPDETALSVTDDGVGLSEEKLREMQDIPHYMESTDEKLNLRHGLGLLLVRQIVEAHSGKVEIQNGAQGGCKTILRFPRYKT